MKPQPLKGKLRSFNYFKEWIESTAEENHDKIAKEKLLLYVSDLILAVDWFEKEVQSIPEDISVKQFKIQLWHIIPKAFEDVISKSEDGDE